MFCGGTTMGMVDIEVEKGTSFPKGSMLAINKNTKQVEMAADKEGLLVVGACASKTAKRPNGKWAVRIDQMGIYRFQNSTVNPIPRDSHQNCVCYVEKENTVSLKPGANAVDAGNVVSVDDNGVFVDISRFRPIELGFEKMSGVMDNLMYLLGITKLC